MMLCVFTLILFIVGIQELKEIRTNRNAEFINSFSKDFFTPQCRELIMLFENDLIEWKVSLPKIHPQSIDSNEINLNDLGCFVVKYKQNPRIKQILLDSNKIIYTSYEIDDILLNKLDIIGGYELSGIIKVEDVSRTFGFYFYVIWQNREIRNYLTWMESKYPNNDFFINLSNVYNKIVEYDKKK
jgi:hypothetical protein